MTKDRLTKEDERNLPKFSSKDDAVKYFEEKYGEDFIFKQDFKYQGENVYLYYYLLDSKKYYKVQEFKRIKGYSENGYLPTTEETDGYTDSFQEIQIWENGKVQILTP